MNVSIRVNTEGEAVNAVDGTVGFNPDILEVSSVNKGTAVSLWVQEPSYSNKAGNISFGGVILNPGYNGSNGNILTINFRAKGVGNAEVVFKAGSVLANDGYGTNVLKAMNGASFNINAPNSQQPQASPTQIPAVVSSFEISSSTHPNQDKWYSNKNPVFEWQLPSDARSVKLVLAKNLSSPPLIAYDPPISRKELSDVADGVWYFKVQFDTGRVSKPIATYKFQIDTQEPADFIVDRIDEDDLTNPRPELVFESSDGLSGIDRYEMKIGDGDWFNIEPNLAGKPYKLSFLLPGTHEVLLKAIDKAGNSTSSNIKVVVKPVSIPKPSIKEIFFPQTKIDNVTIVKEEATVKEATVKGIVMVKDVAIKVVAVKVDVLKLEDGNTFGQISGSVKNTNEKLIKTIEAPIDEGGNFEAKIENLETGTYIIRTYGKDERGAVSDAFSDVVLKVVGNNSVLTQFAKWVSGATLRGFDSLINLLSRGWLLIMVGAVIASLVILTIKNVAPFIADETRKIRYIASEYRASKKLKKLDSKTKLELKILEKDIKKELELLNKIANHRSLHSDEQYLRNKLEKYYNVIKKL